MTQMHIIKKFVQNKSIHLTTPYKRDIDISMTFINKEEYRQTILQILKSNSKTIKIQNKIEQRISITSIFAERKRVERFE